MAMYRPIKKGDYLCELEETMVIAKKINGVYYGGSAIYDLLALFPLIEDGKVITGESILTRQSVIQAITPEDIPKLKQTTPELVVFCGKDFRDKVLYYIKNPLYAWLFLKYFNTGKVFSQYFVQSRQSRTHGFWARNPYLFPICEALSIRYQDNDQVNWCISEQDPTFSVRDFTDSETLYKTISREGTTLVGVKAIVYHYNWWAYRAERRKINKIKADFGILLLNKSPEDALEEACHNYYVKEIREYEDVRLKKRNEVIENPKIRTRLEKFDLSPSVTAYSWLINPNDNDFLHRMVFSFLGEKTWRTSAGDYTIPFTPQKPATPQMTSQELTYIS